LRSDFLWCICGPERAGHACGEIVAGGRTDGEQRLGGRADPGMRITARDGRQESCCLWNHLAPSGGGHEGRGEWSCPGARARLQRVPNRVAESSGDRENGTGAGDHVVARWSQARAETEHAARGRRVATGQRSGDVEGVVDRHAERGRRLGAEDFKKDVRPGDECFGVQVWTGVPPPDGSPRLIRRGDEAVAEPNGAAARRQRAGADADADREPDRVRRKKRKHHVRAVVARNRDVGRHLAGREDDPSSYGAGDHATY
jgi:hypothetical protein